MPRVKRGVTAHARHKKILDKAKGYRGARSKVFRVAKQAVTKAGQVKIPGKLQYHSAHKVASSGNLLLKILVDEDAEPRFKELSYQLRMGASGYVKFEDDRAKRKVDKRTRAKQIEDLEAELEAEKKKLDERIKYLNQLKNSDNESVASMGLSGLNVGDKDKAEDMDTETLLAREEGEASPKPGDEKVLEDM